MPVRHLYGAKLLFGGKSWVIITFGIWVYEGCDVFNIKVKWDPDKEVTSLAGKGNGEL